MFVASRTRQSMENSCLASLKFETYLYHVALDRRGEQESREIRARAFERTCFCLTRFVQWWGNINESIENKQTIKKKKKPQIRYNNFNILQYKSTTNISLFLCFRGLTESQNPNFLLCVCVFTCPSEQLNKNSPQKNLTFATNIANSLKKIISLKYFPIICLLSLCPRKTRTIFPRRNNQQTAYG